MLNRYSLLAVLALVFCQFRTAAGAIVGLYGTGLDASGALLALTTVDPHFTLVQYPGQVGTTPAPTYALSGITFTYDTTGTASQWISWSPNWVNATPSGVWVYRTTFDLTGVNLNTVSLDGRFMSDDVGTVFLNGVNTGIISQSASSYTPIDLTSGFVSGINTLDFQVVNAPFTSFNPSALRVELDGIPVPEPSTVCVIIVGIGVLAGIRMRWTPPV